ncbi:tyrosine--tRNA ligase [Candidatus Peregrinibacteria bacterium CG1_02_41_10]|nr:MAG: tyrosine--tRNA ligase [Candidatus Peregrinibacteria bacterium CG1_02_41_10]
MSANTDPKAIDEVLSRGVEEIVVEKALREKMQSGRVLRVKHGVDPTTSDLHLGHAVNYEKLRQFQELGHKIVFLIGSFTARFGDPTDKSETRKMRDKKEVEAMAKNYIGQLGRLLDISKLEIRYNGEWYDQMNAEELLHLMSEFTVARMLERDMFQERIKEGRGIGLHEPVYPVLQGYDSVMLESDLTVVGRDQKFNELQARPLQETRGQKPQDVVCMPLLVGTDGKKKMSQSLGNYVALNDDPKDKYGKIMSLPDELIFDYFTLLTRLSLKEIEELKQELKQGKNPRDCKMRLGREIVQIYDGLSAAQEAERCFVSVVQNKEKPEEIEEYKLKESLNLVDVLVNAGMVDSKSAARRLIEQGGVKVNDQKVEDVNLIIKPEGQVIQAGKRKFVKIVD